MMIVFFYLGFACACGVLANTRGRNGFGWLVLAILISPILAAAFLLALPKREGVVAPTPTPVTASGPITPRTMGILRTLAVAIIGLVVVVAIVTVTRSASVVPTRTSNAAGKADEQARYQSCLSSVETNYSHSWDNACARVNSWPRCELPVSIASELNAGLEKDRDRCLQEVNAGLR